MGKLKKLNKNKIGTHPQEVQGKQVALPPKERLCLLFLF
jgi:hypothetical protein